MSTEIDNKNINLQHTNLSESGTTTLPETDKELQQRENGVTEELAFKLYGLNRPALQDIVSDVNEITRDPNNPAENSLKYEELGTQPDGLRLANRETALLINPEFAEGKSIEELEKFFDKALLELKEKEEITGPTYSDDDGERGYTDLDFHVRESAEGKKYLVVEQPFF